MIITTASHLDHALTAEHIEFIKITFGGRSAFFIETLEMPSHLPSLPCALYGPIMGDEPIADDRVYKAKRGNRSGESRMIARPARPSRILTVIAGPHEDKPCILYTAYAGPISPREPFDSSLIHLKDKEESEAFWSKHALAGFNENGEAIV